MLRYHFDKVYGLPGIFFGIFLMSLGCYYIFQSFSGFFSIVFGAFLVFTDSACVIDVKRFRISFPYELMGIIRIGDWVYVRSDMELHLTETRKPYKVRCASNKIFDVSSFKYLIFLYDAKRNKWFLIFRSKTKEKAENEMARLSDLLDIQIKENNLTIPSKCIKM